MWYRSNTKLTVENTKRIDVRKLHKQGSLQPHHRGILNWSINGEPSGSIAYCAYEDHLHLSFRTGSDEDGWESFNQYIYFDKTPCHYGEERVWFLCPNCSTRVAILCKVSDLFLCRHCYRLPYESQQVDWLSRRILKKHKLGERIFEGYDSDYGRGKKKGMHWRTFDKKLDEYIQLEEELENAIHARFGPYLL